MEALKFIQAAGTALAPWANWSLIAAVAFAVWWLRGYLKDVHWTMKGLAQRQNELGEISSGQHDGLRGEMRESFRETRREVAEVRGALTDHLVASAKPGTG